MLVCRADKVAKKSPGVLMPGLVCRKFASACFSNDVWLSTSCHLLLTATRTPYIHMTYCNIPIQNKRSNLKSRGKVKTSDAPTTNRAYS
jgi:hypothetical protein